MCILCYQAVGCTIAYFSAFAFSVSKTVAVSWRLCFPLPPLNYHTNCGVNYYERFKNEFAHSFCILIFCFQVEKADIDTQFLKERVLQSSDHRVRVRVKNIQDLLRFLLLEKHVI